MKHSDQGLRQFGAFLRSIRKELGITTDLLAAEIGSSKRLFNKV